MNKLLSALILIFAITSNVVIAGEDGKIKVNGNKNNNGYV